MLFRAGALALPVLLMLAGELGLRLAGVGAAEPLFMRLPDRSEYTLANPAVIRRFFPNPAAAPGIAIETFYFKTEKPQNSLRLVVQGGSTAAGFPYGLGASPSGALQFWLNDAFPEDEIEVISTAMSAVNSYALLDFADEILEQEPDVVIIYAGHNEFLGIMGVGSAMSASVSPWATRLKIRLRGLRVYRVLEGVMARLLLGDGKAAAQGPRTMMERVAGQNEIPYGSSLYRAGVAQFRRNMNALLKKYADAGVPVLLGTLASNERDLRPFTSLADASVADAARRQRSAGLAALVSGEAAAACEALEQVVASREDWAAAWFDLGRAYVAAGREDKAAAAFARARDLDLLRFRAPTEFNEVLVELAQLHGAVLVDVEAKLRAASPDQIPGTELFLEHVHPNLQGYRLLAQAFFEKLLETDILPPRPEQQPTAALPGELPVSEVDSLFGEYKVARMMSGWPFRSTYQPYRLPPADTDAERLAQALYQRKTGWSAATEELRQIYRRDEDIAGYARTSRMLADAFPFVIALQFDAGEALLRQDRARLAVRYLQRARSMAPGEVSFSCTLADALVAAGRVGEARVLYHEVLAEDPAHERARTGLACLPSGN